MAIIFDNTYAAMCVPTCKTSITVNGRTLSTRCNIAI